MLNVNILNIVIGVWLDTEDILKIDQLSKYFYLFVNKDLIVESKVNYNSNFLIKNIKCKNLFVDWFHKDSFSIYFDKFYDVVKFIELIILFSTPANITYCNSKVLIYKKEQQLLCEKIQRLNTQLTIIKRQPTSTYENINYYYNLDCFEQRELYHY